MSSFVPVFSANESPMLTSTAASDNNQNDAQKLDTSISQTSMQEHRCKRGQIQ